MYLLFKKLLFLKISLTEKLQYSNVSLFYKLSNDGKELFCMKRKYFQYNPEIPITRLDLFKL